MLPNPNVGGKECENCPKCKFFRRMCRCQGFTFQGTKVPKGVQIFAEGYGVSCPPKDHGYTSAHTGVIPGTNSANS